MKRSFIFMIFVIVCKTSFTQNTNREQQVKNVVIAFQNDFNDGRFIHAASYTTADWTHINPGGGITNCREEVLKEVRAVHQDFLKGVSLRIESINIRFPANTVAVATVVHTSSDYEFPMGVKHHNERQMKTYLIVMQKNKWLLLLDQNTTIAAR